MLDFILREFIFESTTNQSLTSKNGVSWVGHSLSFGGDADQSLFIISESYY